ncbi:MAG: VOC family protein [Actinobacteria bacterium]|nr:VOC family protein [Actinomycetota bacterium]
MSRLQLALNVTDLDAAIEHYSRLFGTTPAKIKPGYANFAITNPPLKLVLFENSSAEAGSINHLGVEVETREEVAAEFARVKAAGLKTSAEGETTCCFAVQDKFWVDGSLHDFEIYTVLAPADVMHETQDAACCTTEPVAAGRCC